MNKDTGWSSRWSGLSEENEIWRKRGIPAIGEGVSSAGGELSRIPERVTMTEVASANDAPVVIYASDPDAVWMDPEFLFTLPEGGIDVPHLVRE